MFSGFSQVRIMKVYINELHLKIDLVLYPARAEGLENVDIRDGGARGVMVIVVGNGHGDTSSNPGRDWLHFT